MFKNIIIAALVTISFGVVGTAVYQHARLLAVQQQTEQLSLGDSASGAFPGFTNNNQYQVGKGWATRVATLNSGRTFLEIGNYSGATSTAQTIYCTTSVRDFGATTTSVFSFPAGNPTYQGFAVQASSSKSFGRATGIPSSPIYCVNPVASSTVSVVEY